MKEPVVNEIDIVGMDFARVEARSAALAMGYGGGKTQYMKMLTHAINYGTGAAQVGTMIHDEFQATWIHPPVTPKPKGKQPWQKGFIPTVGKKPDLPAPVLGGEWVLDSRGGNTVEYKLRNEDPFSYGDPRICGELVKRQWIVKVSRMVDESTWQTQTIFRSSNYAACVVFVALDDELNKPEQTAWGQYLNNRGPSNGVFRSRYNKP